MDKTRTNNNTEQKNTQVRVPISAAPITIFSQRRNDEDSNNSNRTEEAKQPPRGDTSSKNDDLIHALKMRLVKGEISKEKVSPN